MPQPQRPDGVRTAARGPAEGPGRPWAELRPEQEQQIVERDILPALLDQARHAPDRTAERDGVDPAGWVEPLRHGLPVGPGLWIVGGQPGTPVDLAAAHIRSWPGMAEALTIRFEDLRGYHPGWHTLLSKGDVPGAYEASGPYAEQWTWKASSRLIHGRHPLIVAGAAHAPQITPAILQTARLAGYHTGLYLIAAPAAVSRLSLIRTYGEAIATVGRAHLLPWNVHDDAFHGLLRTARQAARYADTVHVVDQTMRPTHWQDAANTGVDPDALSLLGPGSPALELSRERDRVWNAEESTAFLANIRELLRQHPHLRGELEAALTLGIPHLHQNPVSTGLSTEPSPGPDPKQSGPDRPGSDRPGPDAAGLGLDRVDPLETALDRRLRELSDAARQIAERVQQTHERLTGYPQPHDHRLPSIGRQPPQRDTDPDLASTQDADRDTGPDDLEPG